MKKKSPVVEMTGQILDAVQEHNVLVYAYRQNIISLLQEIEWNLSKAWPLQNLYVAQALGLVKGAMHTFGAERWKG